MTFAFRTAVREQTPLFIGLVGPSSSGKTMSALRLAAGIQSVVGGTICGIDTESRRMLHYARRFAFQYTEFGEPFGSDRYLEAVQSAVATGARTVIVDSMSHEHEGPGGYLEFHEEEVQRLRRPASDGGGGFTSDSAAQIPAWSRPAARRRRLINGLLQLNVNCIFCFRAKEKIKLAKVKKEGSNGRVYERTEPVELGWQAIAGEEFVYEMTCRFLLPPGARGVPDTSAEAAKTGVPKMPDDLADIIGRDRQLDEDTGAQLARWAMGDAPRQQPGERPPRTPRHDSMVADFEVVAREQGFEAFLAAWERTAKDDRAAIGRAERDRIAAIGRTASSARQPDAALIGDGQ